MIGEDLLVVAEEFGEWDDSNRRIDLLCVARDGALVVVEIKRTADGGHMELQAIRYAAVVSGMTLDQVVHAHARAHSLEEEVSRTTVLGFLQSESDDEAALSGAVRIVLVFCAHLAAHGWLHAEGDAALDTLTAEAQRAIDLLEERRSALISAAVTGLIDVRGLAPA